MLAEIALAKVEALLGENHDGAALGSLVGKRCELRHLGELALLDAVDGEELGGLPVPERDRAGLVEQQHVDVTRGLDRASRHGEHVPLHEPIHACDADRRQQGADRRRDQRDEQRDEDGLRDVGSRVDRERAERDDGCEEGDREPGEQDVERDLVGRLAPLGTLDEGDHTVEERLARLLRDLDHEPVGQEPGAAGDRRAVAAGFADHGGGLSGDRRLVDRAHALDDLSVGRDDLAGLDHDDVAALEICSGDLFEAAARGATERRGRRARGPQSVRLGLASPFGDRLGEVGEQHGQPEPEGDHTDEPEIAGVTSGEVEQEDSRRDHAAELDDEHHRIPHLQARVELREGVLDGRESEVAREDARRLTCHYCPVSLSSARLSSRTLTPVSPKNPSDRSSVDWSMRR